MFNRDNFRPFAAFPFIPFFIFPFISLSTLIRANWQRAFFFSSGKGILFILLSFFLSSSIQPQPDNWQRLSFSFILFQASTDQTKPNRAAKSFLSWVLLLLLILAKSFLFLSFLYLSLIYKNRIVIENKIKTTITKYARARVSETRAKIPCFACGLI